MSEVDVPVSQMLGIGLIEVMDGAEDPDKSVPRLSVWGNWGFAVTLLSRYGNTELVAQAIGRALGPLGEVGVVRVGEVKGCEKR